MTNDNYMSSVGGGLVSNMKIVCVEYARRGEGGDAAYLTKGLKD